MTDEVIQGKGKALYGYIVNFYQHVNHLTELAANLVNTTTEIKLKYGDSNSNLSDQDAQDLRTIMLSVRTTIFKTHTKVKALIKQFPTLKSYESELTDAYEILIEKGVIKRKEIEDYVHKLNEALIVGIGEETIEQLAGLVDALSHTRGEVELDRE